MSHILHLNYLWMWWTAYLSMVDDQLEESVHEQNSVWEDTATVQKHRLWQTDAKIHIHFKREKASLSEGKLQVVPLVS